MRTIIVLAALLAVVGCEREREATKATADSAVEATKEAGADAADAAKNATNDAAEAVDDAIETDKEKAAH